MRSRVAIAVAVLAGAFVSGGWLLQRGLSGGEGRIAYARARLFDQVMTHVARQYVDSLPQQELYQKAVEGMLEELNDPHTLYLTPDRFSRLTESTTGTYGGLGIQIDVRDGWITVIAPLPGTPAERAGIAMGDRIVKIDDRATQGWTNDEASKALRGKPGTTVALSVQRPGVEEPMPFRLTRRDIHVRAVQRVTMLRPDVGYFDVNVFSESTATEMTDAVERLRQQGMRALIIDLRGNPGGLLDEGVSTSDLFLDPGQPIVSMRGRNRLSTRDYSDRTAQRWPDLPIVVLLNEGSASASEILAGALQDHDRAVLVGRTSYGKGSAQSLFGMSGGGALKLTTARWYTPLGRSITREGASDRDDERGDGEDIGDAPKATPITERETFRTKAGRIVYGGGGITPDVLAGDTATAPADLAFQRALGAKLPQFRDALTDYAIALKVARAVATPDFEVTAAMRTDVWRRMQARGIRMDRTVYDDATPLITRLLTYEIARYVFGADAEFRRISRNDAIIAAALELTADSPDRAEVLRRAAEKHPSKAVERKPE